MAIATEKYARKPMYVDAVKVTKENFAEVAEWCHGDIREPDDEQKYIRVRVLKPTNPRQTKAMIGDWILYTEGGGFKVYTHKAFKGAFSRLDTEETPNRVQAVTSQVGK